MDKKVFGIDLGTTYSCVAYIDDTGRPVVLKNSEGDLTTPSVVFFDGGEVIVGESAKESSKMYPDQSVSFIKRDIGKPNSNVFIEGEEMTPSEVSSYILKKITKDAEDNLRMEGVLGDDEHIKDVVITCPAYFGINERAATETAGELAGLNVLQIINEPTAAAITYGTLDDSEEKTVLVYDLGGGTFDVTMINVKPGAITVVVTGGDHNLGGKDWDDTIMLYVDDQFRKETGSSDSPLDDPETLQEISLSVEKAKMLLTAREKAPISVNHMGNRARIELTREKFDELTKGNLDRTLALTEDMFKEAEKKGYSKSDVSEILLVGGSSKMPQVAKAVQERFGIPTKMFDPDESVAKGAAIFAEKELDQEILIDEIASATGKSKEEIEKDVKSGKADVNQLAESANVRRIGGTGGGINISNVSSRSFGTLAFNANNQERLFNLIMRNDNLPAEATQSFFPSSEGQKDVVIKILENLSSDPEIDPALGTEVGEAKLELPSGIDKTTEIQITFRLNDSGMLELEAKELKENNSVKATFEVTEDLDEEEKSTAMRRISGSSVS